CLAADLSTVHEGHHVLQTFFGSLSLRQENLRAVALVHDGRWMAVAAKADHGPETEAARDAMWIGAVFVHSPVLSASILRTAWITVVWSRPPNSRPIAGNDRSFRCV